MDRPLFEAYLAWRRARRWARIRREIRCLAVALCVTAGAAPAFFGLSYLEHRSLDLRAINQAMAGLALVATGAGIGMFQWARFREGPSRWTRWAPYLGASGLAVSLGHLASSLTLIQTDGPFRRWCLEHPLGVILGAVSFGYLTILTILALADGEDRARALLVRTLGPVFCALSAHLLLLSVDRWSRWLDEGTWSRAPVSLASAVLCVAVLLLWLAAGVRRALVSVR